jgi:XisI protein
MDKLENYRSIIRSIVTEIAEMTPSDKNSETQLVMDDNGGHYILFSIGWQDIMREYLPFVHIDLKPDGKVWIQHDGTDLKIALLLADKGVLKQDIVLAFHSPNRRKLLPEFAEN